MIELQNISKSFDGVSGSNSRIPAIFPGSRAKRQLSFFKMTVCSRG